MKIDKNLIHNLSKQADGLNTINGGSIMPSVDVKEGQEGVTINIFAPSIDGENFNIFIKGDHLIIYSIYNNENQNQDNQQFDFPLFTRTFFVPSFIDRENIDAVYKDGELKVFMPYNENINQAPQKINVRFQ